MALLLILFALFGFVFAGIESGSSSSGDAMPVVPSAQEATAPRPKGTTCVVTTWRKGQAAQQRPCPPPPALP